MSHECFFFKYMFEDTFLLLLYLHRIMTTRSTIPVQNITTCVICRQHFDDPRMLPCLHTYCLRCIQEGIMSNNGHFECPLRDGTKVDEKSIDSLPSNRIARDIVELLSQYITNLFFSIL